MIRSFRNRNTQRYFEGYRVREFQRFHTQATRRLTILDNAETLGDLAELSSNRLKVLRGDRVGQYSICFRWTEDGPVDVEIVDYH